MLSEEQAVENLEKLVKLRKNIRGEITHDTCICGTSDLDTGLKLINKLKKENEELSEKNIEKICRVAEEEVLQEYRDKITRLQKENTQEKESWEKYCNELNEEIIEKNNKIFDLEMQVEKLQKEKKEKDKQIDLMVEWIEKHTKYYYEDGCYCEVEKEICEKDIECKDCIKQHFEKLAKEKGE